MADHQVIGVMTRRSTLKGLYRSMLGAHEYSIICAMQEHVRSTWALSAGAMQVSVSAQHVSTMWITRNVSPKVLSCGIASIGFWHTKSCLGIYREGRSPRTPRSFRWKILSDLQKSDQNHTGKWKTKKKKSKMDVQIWFCSDLIQRRWLKSLAEWHLLNW